MEFSDGILLRFSSFLLYEPPEFLETLSLGSTFYFSC